MINRLKELINKDNEIKEALEGLSDDFLLNNAAIIMAALDSENIKEGFKIKIAVDHDEKVITWTYVPTGQDEVKRSAISETSKKYTYKLPKDLENYYLIDLNDVTWTDNKRELASEFKRMLEEVDNEQFTKKGIWVFGPSNLGKTHASIGFLNNCVKRGKSVAFVNVSDLILNTQNSFSAYSANDTNQSYIDQIRAADVVVLDDIGAERPTPWFKENILLPIIDYRFKSNKLTVFTSNSDVIKYAGKLKARSQNPEVEQDTNDKIINRIQSLITKEVEVKK